MSSAISTRALSKTFGGTVALDALDLDVPAGTVLGYLGPNGAGKTTTIRLLMGLLRPSSGRAEVLGHDVVTDRVALHRAVGYLPGDFAAYRDLTADEYLTYLAHLRGDVERADVESLAERFDLDMSRRIGTLSRGNRQKVGIVQACMHRPPLLVLDEPTSGLDPLMRHEFIDLVREHRDAGGTVFLSSHELAEVKEVADSVAILRDGRLVVVAEVEDLRAQAIRRVHLTFVDRDTPPLDVVRAVPGVRDVEVENSAVSLVVEGPMAELLLATAPYGIDRVTAEEADLSEVFMRYYEGT